METWLASSLVRHYPTTRPRRRKTLRLLAARGEQISFQCAFRTGDVAREVTATAEAHGLDVRVRRVGYVPMPHFNADTPPEETDGVGHLPGWAPDPLLPETRLEAGARETNAFWITVRVGADVKPGPYPVHVTLAAKEEQPETLTATVRVHRAVVGPRRELPVTQWFYADALCDWYKLEPFEDAFWPLLEGYLADLVDHKVNVSHLPLFTPPTDGVKRPNQLLDVRRRGSRYTFDWTLVRRWTELARQQGIEYFE